MRVERGRLFVDNDAPEWWAPGEYVLCTRHGNNVGAVLCMHLSKFKPGASKISDGLSISINTKLFITGEYIVEKTDGESIVLLYKKKDYTQQRAKEAQEKAKQYTNDIGVNLDTPLEQEAFLKKVIWEVYTGKKSPNVLTAISKSIEYLIDNHDIIHRPADTADKIDYRAELEKLIRNSSTSDSTKLNAIRDLIKRGDVQGEDNTAKRVRRKVLIENDNGD